jgi:hypothetical protein
MSKKTTVDERGPSTVYWIEADPGLYTILVRHPHNSKVSDNTEFRARSRYFANWARKQFTKPSEYREARVGFGYDRYFIMYGLTPSEFMLVKLTWKLHPEELQLRSKVNGSRSIFLKSIDAAMCRPFKQPLKEQYKSIKARS